MVSAAQTVLVAFLSFYSFLRVALAAEQQPLSDQDRRYKYGDPIPVSCMNRTIDTGEHVSDDRGRLQYIPFPTCNETGRPLELYFGVEKDVNCTIDFISDEFFHLLEFYVHNDVPMTCRLPTRPLSTTEYVDPSNSHQVGALGSESTYYTPFVVALSGILQLSHVHVANNLNVLVHAAPKSIALGVIDAATAYSVSTTTRNTKIVIGDPLQLRLGVRWYPSASLPSGWQGVGGHLTHWTLLYCLLSAGASAAICITYFRGFDLPRRLRSHGHQRIGLLGPDRGPSGGRLGGYGYGISSSTNGFGGGYGYSGSGKYD
ncbi:MAG: hypothetical protein Q9162_007861 [Coniocarpon cinnabarinum]